MKRFTFHLVTGILFLFSCTSQKNSTGRPITSLKFIDEYFLPHKLKFNGTTIGGLSGIDYVASEDLYYMISDDRSDIDPARFYTAKISLNEKGIDTLQMIQVTTLLQANGKSYPSHKINPVGVPDPEAIRMHSKTGDLYWCSEGERIVESGRKVLTDPAIYVMDKTGQLKDSFLIPANMHIRATENGPRRNGGFEGMTFSPDQKSLFVSVEEPLFEDGPRARLGDTAGWIRIVRYDVASKKPEAQFAYQLDPVVQEPILPGLFIVNGVTDILAVNDHQLLVTERSFSTGRLGCNIRLYLVDLNKAADVTNNSSLLQKPPVNPLPKKLLLNMDKLGRLVDNVEGATLGPLLPNGKRSLLFVTDDNFSTMDRTQILLFEVQ